jgi:hypothetical protein
MPHALRGAFRSTGILICWGGLRRVTRGYFPDMGFLLWIAAVILVVAGIVTLIKGGIILGIVLIVVGLAVGPGGWSVFNRRS